MKQKNHAMFTIIELLVVIAIIIILAAMLIPVIKVITEKSSRAQTQAQMQTIMEALEEYKAFYGYYPITYPLNDQVGDTDGNTYKIGTISQLTESFLDDNMGSITKYNGVDPSDVIWKGKYGASATDGVFLVDPYDEPYYYNCPGKMNRETYDLWSTGSDLEHGDKEGIGLTNAANALKRDDNDDVTNWKNDFQ